jgi:teichoic acid transport system permease protein
MSTRLKQLRGRLRRAVEYVQELWRRREFAVFLGLGNLKARNAGTALGILWWVLNPLLLGGVYFLIFGLIFPGRRPPDFLIYLMSGMFVFHFTSHSLTGGANSVLQNAKLLANLRFPRLVLPISTLIEATVGFLVSLGVLVVLSLIARGPGLGINSLLLPVILVIHVIFNLGLGAATARLAVPFRDINNFVPYLVRIWLYLSPIIWPLSMLDTASAAVRTLIRFNPMYSIIGVYRTALLDYPFHPHQFLLATAWSLAVGIFGIAVFVRYEGNMVRYL